MSKLAESQMRIKPFVRRSVSILLVLATLAVSTLAQGADSKTTPQDDGTIIRLVTPQKEGTALQGSEAYQSERDVLFAQQAAPWCYTNIGRFPMYVALPAGVSCSVNLPYWPYYVTGVTGY
jgi:hypothetical protein